MRRSRTSRRIVGLFHFGLRDGGCLFLGKVESVGRQHDLFVALSRKHRIYRRIGATRKDPVDPPRQAPARLPRRAASAAFAPAQPVGLAVLTREALLARFVPASVLIDSAHPVHYYHGSTDRFLAQPTGEPTSDLLALTRRGLVGPSRRAIKKAVETGATAVERGSVRRSEGQLSLRVRGVTAQRWAQRRHAVGELCRGRRGGRGGARLRHGRDRA